MLDDLDRAVTSERRFAGDASHELRTPLTLLTSRLQLAQRRSRRIEEHEQVLAELTPDVDRLRALADHLLELANRPGGFVATVRLPTPGRTG
jgi:two-component system OmpR family sensor kinase